MPTGYNEICPYCGGDIIINHDDIFEEDERYEYDNCPHCEKVFLYSMSVHIRFETHKADCLNGNPHNYKKDVCCPPEYAKTRCVVCGNIKT